MDGKDGRIMVMLFSALFVLQAFLYTSPETCEVYLRPDHASAVFGYLLPGEQVRIEAVTAQGWLGFDPGVAQAGNSGSFRYRWLPPDDSLTGLDSLETVWAPAPLVTYAMTFNDTPLYPGPDTASAPFMYLPGNSAAGIMLQYGNWFLVNPAQGPCECSTIGWLQSDAVSVNGELHPCELLFHIFHRQHK